MLIQQHAGTVAGTCHRRPSAAVGDDLICCPYRAYWGYHRHLAPRAQKLFDSLDPQLQRHINEEKVAMEKGGSGGGGDRPASSMGVRGHKKAASQDLTESGKWPPGPVLEL